ncbi:hypothetical protein N7454_006258 [Penicillium verhagenii]|nr:hypothetical protein N7454_006258 [Penicillium verhagenii]
MKSPIADSMSDNETFDYLVRFAMYDRTESWTANFDIEAALIDEFTAYQFAQAWLAIRERALPNPRAAAIAQHWLARFQIPNLPVPRVLSRSCITNPREFVRVRRNTPWTELVAPQAEHAEQTDAGDEGSTDDGFWDDLP